MDVATQQLESNPPLKAQPQPWLRCRRYITIQAQVRDLIKVTVKNQRSTGKKFIEHENMQGNCGSYSRMKS